MTRHTIPLILLALLAGCPAEPYPGGPPLRIGEWRASNTGSESLAAASPYNALRALVQAAQDGPFECLPGLVECYDHYDNAYSLVNCRLNQCEVTFNTDVVGHLTLSTSGTTWRASGDYMGREVQLLRDGVGAIAVVTWRAAVLRAEAAYADPVSEECRESVLSVSVEYLPQAALRRQCGTTLNIGGCSYTASGRTYIEDVLMRDELTHSHELLHHLLACELGNSDHNHRDNAWRRL